MRNFACVLSVSVRNVKKKFSLRVIGFFKDFFCSFGLPERVQKYSLCKGPDPDIMREILSDVSKMQICLAMTFDGVNLYRKTWHDKRICSTYLLYHLFSLLPSCYF